MQEEKKGVSVKNGTVSNEEVKDEVSERLLSMEKACSCLSAYISAYKQDEMRKALDSDIVSETLLNIPALPLFICHLTKMHDDDSANFDSVAQEIMQDPNLVALIMKQVNSAQYGLSKKVDSFKLAISLLGFDEVFRLAVKAHALDVMPGSRKLEELMDHSIAVSRMSYEIARKINHPKPSALSLLGILHDMGVSALYYIKDRMPLLADFTNLLDTDCLGARLLEKWELPKKVCGAIKMQNCPAYMPVDKLPREEAVEISILFLAHLCDQHLYGKMKVDASSAYVPEYLDFIGLHDCFEISQLVASVILPQLKKHKWTFTSPI